MVYPRMNKFPRLLIFVFPVILFLISLSLYCGDGSCGSFIGRSSKTPPDIFVPKQQGVEIVAAKIKKEDTSWVDKYLPDWAHSIYVVDDPEARLTVAVNKGHEAMVYLTYMIDRYDSLPDITVFIHASRFQWHIDNPDYDGLLSLRNLSLTHIRQEGYVNLRCVWTLGCPSEIEPFNDEKAAAGKTAGDPVATKDIFKKAFEELMPGVEVPQRVGVSCCSQFATTKETIRRRPREDYIRFRTWLVNTHLDDDLSGRVFEYLWHIIFGKDAVHCPPSGACYCKLYGLCGLTCTDAHCNGRYVLPHYSKMPSGWPRKGWKGEDRLFEGPV